MRQGPKLQEANDIVSKGFLSDKVPVTKLLGATLRLAAFCSQWKESGRSLESRVAETWNCPSVVPSRITLIVRTSRFPDQAHSGADHNKTRFITTYSLPGYS
jgi:hypothetical protein